MAAHIFLGFSSARFQCCSSGVTRKFLRGFRWCSSLILFGKRSSRFIVSASSGDNLPASPMDCISTCWCISELSDGRSRRRRRLTKSSEIHWPRPICGSWLQCRSSRRSCSGATRSSWHFQHSRSVSRTTISIAELLDSTFPAFWFSIPPTIQGTRSGFLQDPNPLEGDFVLALTCWPTVVRVWLGLCFTNGRQALTRINDGDRTPVTLACRTTWKHIRGAYVESFNGQVPRRRLERALIRELWGLTEAPPRRPNSPHAGLPRPNQVQSTRPLRIKAVSNPGARAHSGPSRWRRTEEGAANKLSRLSSACHDRSIPAVFVRFHF